MRVHPAIAALRADTSSQRNASSSQTGKVFAAKQDWLSKPEMMELSEELRRYAEGADLTDCAGLRELLSDCAVASRFIRQFTEPMIHALRDEPLSDVPTQYKSSPGLSTLHLMARGNALLSLSAYEPVASDAIPRSAVFSDRSSVELVIGGKANGTIHRRTGGELHSTKIEWGRGDVIRCDPMLATRQILNVERTLVLLQLTRSATEARPCEEVLLSDGRIVRTASGDKTASSQSWR